MTIIADGIVVVVRDSNAAITSDGAFSDNTGATISVDVTKCSDNTIISIDITRNDTANSIDNGIVVVARDSNAAITINGAFNDNTGATISVDVTKCSNNAIISIDITCNDTANIPRNGTANSIDSNTGVVNATSCNDNTAVSIVSFT